MFEIHDSGVDVAGIMEEITSELDKISVEKSELEKIARLSFTPPSPAGLGKFDPLGTASLFEKGISPPGFTNPRFRFIKGPFKWLVLKLVNLYGMVDRKLSENRTRAFYNIVHEIIMLNNRMDVLNERIESVYEKLDSVLKKDSSDISGYYLPGNFFLRAKNSHDDDIVSKLKKVKTLVLLPGRGEFLDELKKKGIPFGSMVADKTSLEYIRKNFDSSARLADSAGFREWKNYRQIVVYRKMDSFSSIELENLFGLIKKYCSGGTVVFMNYAAAKNNLPFEDNQQLTVRPELLKTYLRERGFTGITDTAGKNTRLLVFKTGQ